MTPEELDAEEASMVSPVDTSNDWREKNSDIKRLQFDYNCERIDDILCVLDEFADDPRVITAVRELQEAYCNLAHVVENMDNEECQNTCNEAQRTLLKRRVK